MKKLLILLVLIGFPLLVGLTQTSGGESSGGDTSGGTGIDSGGTGGVPSGGSESGGSGSGGTVKLEPVKWGQVTPFAPCESLPSGIYDFTRAIDLDTIVVQEPGDGLWRSVRIKNIDSPEHGSLYFAEGKELVADLIGDTATLEVIDLATDQYGRLLADVVLDDGRDYAVVALQSGLADVYEGVTDAVLLAARDGARSVGKGIWAGEPFADRNCSSFKSRAEAQTFFEGARTLEYPDRHRLDGSPRDGVACSSLPQAR